MSETEERLEQYTQGQVYVLSEGLWTVAGDPAKGVRVQVEYDQGGNTITNDGNDPNNTAFNVVPATGHSYFGELNQQTGHMDVFFPPRPGTGVAGSTDLLTIQPSPIVPPTSATMPALNTFATNEFLALPGVRAS
ncbi:MAG TPA: hypothetical protein VKQ34_04575 [Candidatus Saccharimonadales bacterium]|nr:hypothetical protein [Candidatus Saccharimonadales bacterium]